jgi:SAM-dependent methyltransferase
VSLAVIWHDVECGAYGEDRALWRGLAKAAGGPVLDIGAGTGRVSLDLAACGADVTALDADGELLAALSERARRAGLAVATVTADAREFAIDRRFALVLVPMQTLQLLGGADGRRAFLQAARTHLQPGGRLCAALADALESFDLASHELPPPDRLDRDGVVYLSRPLAVVDEGERVAIHRLREEIGDDAGAEPRTSHDIIRLDRVSAAEVAAEARALGFVVEPPRRIPQTDEYVGSTVVVLRA